MVHYTLFMRLLLFYQHSHSLLNSYTFLVLMQEFLILFISVAKKFFLNTFLLRGSLLLILLLVVASFTSLPFSYVLYSFHKTWFIHQLNKSPSYSIFAFSLKFVFLLIYSFNHYSIFHVCKILFFIMQITLKVFTVLHFNCFW